MPPICSLVMYLMLFISYVGESPFIPVQFDDEEEIYNLDWNKILSPIQEQPFQFKDELTVGTRVLAPWCEPSSSAVSKPRLSQIPILKEVCKFCL